MTLGVTNVDIALGILACLIFIGFLTQARRIPKGSYPYTIFAIPSANDPCIWAGLRLPPGPPGKLIAGNVKHIPTHHEWETYDRWAKEYGAVVHVEVFGQSMVFLNTIEAAQDLLEKRSSIYSDRSEMPMLNDLMGWDWDFGFIRYGEWWRRHRRVFQQSFHADAAGAFYAVQIKQTRTLLQNYYHTPEKFIEHITHLTCGSIMEIVYGIHILPRDDPYMKTAKSALDGLNKAGDPAAFLVNSLPILKHIPEWVPGAGFKKKARLWKIPTVEMSEAPFIAVKDAMKAGTAEPSLTASWLEELSQKPDRQPDEEEIIRNVAAVAYGAGFDTTNAALITFILAMILYPEVQRKGQAELDLILGMDRLPVFEDRGSLPYITAICKEVHRWHPVVPLGIAHRLMQDDVYGDYFIPGGSFVFGNAWTILHDEKVYGPKPKEFDPERSFKSGAPNPTSQFGFGRRICPGRHMAENSLWIAVASILKVFNISRAKDANGVEIPVEAAFTSGFITYPKPFQCSIKPRSASAEDLIMENGEM